MCKDEGLRLLLFVVCCSMFVIWDIRAGVQPLAREHTCDVDMRRAYAIGVLDSTEDTLKVHMYWLNVQGLRVKAFVVGCLLFVVSCGVFVHELERKLKKCGACFFVGLFVCAEIKFQQHVGDITGDLGKSS